MNIMLPYRQISQKVLTSACGNCGKYKFNKTTRF